MGIKAGDLVVLVGAGGKTSALNRLAKELTSSGETVVLTTTTKIFPPTGLQYQFHLLKDLVPLDLKKSKPEASKVMVLGKEMNQAQKIVGLDVKEVKKIKDMYPEAVILVEGDGAKGKPFKAPREYEPIIPDDATLVVPVLGIDAIDKPLNEMYFHAVEKLSLLTGLKQGDYFRVKDAAHVLLHCEGYRKGVSPLVRWIPLINKADTPGSRENALELIEILKKAKVQKVILGSLGIENTLVEVF